MKKETIALLIIGGYLAYQFVSKMKVKIAKEQSQQLFAQLRLIEKRTNSTEQAIKETQKYLNNLNSGNVSLEYASKIWTAYLQKTNANPQEFDMALQQAGLLK